MTLAALAAAACGGSQSKVAHAPEHGSGQTGVAGTGSRSPLVSIFEDPAALSSNPGPTLAQLRSLGVQYVRVMVQWRQVAPDALSPSPPANFDAASPSAYPQGNWALYDEIDRDARTLGLGVLFDVGGPGPQWATGPGFISGGAAGVWRPSASEFGAFARAVGARYSGSYTPPRARSSLPRVSFWSIWNEPNLGEADLAPQATDNSAVEASAVSYRGLLDAGWSALQQSGHGRDTILIGELAPLGQTVGNDVPGNFGEMAPLRFIRALYCVDASLQPLRGASAAARQCPTTGSGSFAAEHPALFDATGFAIHPYPGPTRVTPTTILGPEFANLANLPKLETMLQAVSSDYGHPRRWGLWNTEYGYITDPPYPPGAPLTSAAAYENWSEYMSWREPWMRSFDHYLLIDPPVGGRSHFFTGLEFSNASLVHKPTYGAFRVPIYLPVTTTAAGQPLEVWGCARPANTTSAPPPVQIQLQSHATGAFKTVRSAAVKPGDCYFDLTVRFPSAGNVKLAWTYPHGATIYSRVVPIRIG